ncbi:hypothetical protein ACFV19_24955 [Streptomyces griseoluteus]|uniref:hypothetical protein n=1 Tax=Streptomyces griseoluteus TaxID=29306 RepID=UPI0036C09D38
MIDGARSAMHAYHAFTGTADRMTAGMLTTPAGGRAATAPLAGTRAAAVGGSG